MGYRLIMAQTDKEIIWAQNQLEICTPEKVTEFQRKYRTHLIERLVTVVVWILVWMVI